MKWVKFFAIMIVFMAGMILMIINHIHSPAIWLGYAAIWWWAEVKVAKEIHLKWWVWVLIIGGLSILDVILIKYLG